MQVLDAIKNLGNGFLAADRSGELRRILAGGHSDNHSPLAAHHSPCEEFYQALLRLVDRLLFLLYIENKPGWTPATNPVWASSYSISRLREQAEELTSTRADAEDHWEGLKIVFGMIRSGCTAFDIRPYGGELFDDARLGLIRDAALRNSDLLQAIRLLTVFERNRQVYRVNFRTLRIDALGSVYEGLLDVVLVSRSITVWTREQRPLAAHRASRLPSSNGPRGPTYGFLAVDDPSE